MRLHDKIAIVTGAGSGIGLAITRRFIDEGAHVVSTPHLRRMGTLGGNLCLDTRCTYYDQSYQ